MKKLSEAKDSEILAEIGRFQAQQKRYPANSEISKEIGEKLLAPLFAEMASRQARSAKRATL